MGKSNKLAKVTTTLSITAGQYLLALAPNQSWSVGLAAFVTLLAGSSELANILFDDVDIQKLKKQIESNPDDARLFWSIIDAGLREAAKEKIKVYNLYLRGAFDDTELTKENNSKVLLVIQQITLKELDIFQSIYKIFKDLQILNLFHSVDSNNKTLKKIYNSEELKSWFDEFIEENNRTFTKSNYLKDIGFYKRGFFVYDLKKHKLFSNLGLTNEVEMLSAYGLLQSDQAMDGSIYHLTSFGHFMINFIGSNKQ